jgi:hypothetical protein
MSHVSRRCLWYAPSPEGPAKTPIGRNLALHQKLLTFWYTYFFSLRETPAILKAIAKQKPRAGMIPAVCLLAPSGRHEHSQMGFFEKDVLSYACHTTKRGAMHDATSRYPTTARIGQKERRASAAKFHQIQRMF